MERLLNRPNCDLCEKMRLSRGEDTPCSTCTPLLMRENLDIVEVYLFCHNQVKVSPMGGVIDVDILAYDSAVTRLNKAETVFQDAISLARYFLKEQYA